MKTFIVIGLGRFGSSAAEQLYDMGHEVIVVDRDEEAVNHLADRCPGDRSTPGGGRGGVPVRHCGHG